MSGTEKFFTVLNTCFNLTWSQPMVLTTLVFMDMLLLVCLTKLRLLLLSLLLFWLSLLAIAATTLKIETTIERKAICEDNTLIIIPFAMKQGLLEIPSNLEFSKVVPVPG